MSGLIPKDMCLLLQRSKVFIVLIGVGAIMGFTTDGSFVIGYLAMTCSIQPQPRHFRVIVINSCHPTAHKLRTRLFA